MPYTNLASYQFERGKGFTEESVFAFHTLAMEAIYELARNDRPAEADDFPLSDDEKQLVLRHRAATAAPASLAASEPISSYLPEQVSAPLDPEVAAALGNPPDDDFAAAARWLAMATRNETEPYQPSLVRHRG